MVVSAGMAAVVALLLIVSIPGIAVGLVVLAAIDRMGLAAHRRLRLPWRNPEDRRPIAAVGIDELHAIYYASKRHELDEKQTSLMLRDENGDAAPPGTAIIRHTPNTP